MIIRSDEVPQADRLVNLVTAIENIGSGARTDEEIIDGIESLNTDRQGRYYRKVGELLGLVVNEKNNARLTSLGFSFYGNPSKENPILKDSILKMKVFQRLLPYIELKASVSRQDCIRHLESLEINLAHSTIKRRVSSLLGWLVQLDILNKEKNRYKINEAYSPTTGLFEIEDITQPILPETGALSEYEEVQIRTSNAEEAVITYIRNNEIERANNSHKRLVNITAEKIKDSGSIPKYNQLIDLATRYQAQDFIFEMKSTTEQNEKSQIRAGLSQLYEYRYIQNKPSAKLVLVIENPLTQKEGWRADYLESDRDIYLIWDGNDQLYGNERTRNELKFLNIKAS